MKKNIMLLPVLLAMGFNLWGQNQTEPGVPASPEPPKPAPVEELKWNLNADGSHYWKVTFLNQTWFRFNDSNPGTKVLNEEQSNTFDIGLRRTRIQMYGKIARRTFMYFQFGQNNFNFLSNYAGNRKLQPFFHDALGEYEVFENQNYLKIGGGLTITNGLSRFSQPSVGTILTMDVPVFAQATVDQTDEFSRKLSIYARGQVGKLDYRFSLSDPFPVQTNGNAAPVPGSNATFSQNGHTQQYQAYLQWQFWEKEQHITPYMTGTYLGKKKVFNIGAGIISQQNAVITKTATDSSKHNMTLWAVESFLELPINKEKGTAFSGYAGFFNTDYGPGYLRFNGIMNPSNGSSLAGGTGTNGNAYPMFGSGQVIYLQTGYLLPANLLGASNGTLQPYASWQHADYNARLDKPVDVFNVGMNWLISGHKSKVSFNYENRPAFVPDAATPSHYKFDSRKGAFVIQYQVFI